MQSLPRHVVRFGLAAIMALVGCADSPVHWTGARTVNVASTAVALAPGGDVTEDSLALIASRLVAPSVACAGSLRIARSGSQVYAVWWLPRMDSSATLAAARSSDGGATWSSVVAVDSTDRGSMGCARAPAAIAADSASGYVHVSYGMVAAEGAGIFFAHSMDGGATFHAPVPIVYGERVGRTSVAAAADFVAVAFEDPNSGTPRVGLALSRTMGHIFEDRVLPVSDDNGVATRPLVAMQQHRLTVAWQQRLTSNGGGVLRIRTGTFPR